jgi:hypothetical protein
MVRRVLGKIFGLLTAGVVLAAAARPGVAQVPPCAPHDSMVSTLGETFHEQQRAYGLIGPRAILEVFVSDKGGWTIIVTGSDGFSCIIAVGIDWEMVPPAPEETASTQ